MGDSSGPLVTRPVPARIGGVDVELWVSGVWRGPNGWLTLSAYPAGVQSRTRQDALVEIEIDDTAANRAQLGWAFARLDEDDVEPGTTIFHVLPSRHATEAAELADADPDADAAERLCGALYREISGATGGMDAVLGSLTADALTGLVRHHQLDRCGTCTEVALAAVRGEIDRRRTSTSPDAS